ncbi:MAG: ABC transporter ATP-binding protein [Firmicutes bacterium]|nr:ABC transporter ATP-binding protein [Bacillota bacterium]
MIEMKELTKSFGNNIALNELTLFIPGGQVYGLIGPNGAGKTTAMRILATLAAADSGTAIVDGKDIVHDTRGVRRSIGYMPDFFGVYDGLTSREYLSFFASSYNIPEEKHDVLVKDLLELVNLPDKAEAYVDNLSRGMKQRLALARCLVHDPQVLILDEPASGLDPRARAEVKEIVVQLGQMGKTVLISSHILPELSEICDRVGILQNGKLLASGPVPEIISGGKGNRVINIEVTEHMTKLVEYLGGYPAVIQAEEVDNMVRLIFSGNKTAQVNLLREVVSAGYDVVQFSEERGNLEDIFMAVTGEVESNVHQSSTV